MRVVAWSLVATGALAFSLGVALVAVVRPFRFRWRGEDRELWRSLKRPEFHSSPLTTGDARKAIDELRKNNPQLAAEMTENLRRFTEMERTSDPFEEARRFTRMFDAAGYLAAALLLVGAVAAVGGILWL